VKVSKISDYFFLIVEVYPNPLQIVENAHGKKLDISYAVSMDEQIS